MPEYLAPGVFVEEIAAGAQPIEGVGTSTAGFIGLAPQAGVRVNEAYPVNNWTQFLREYVGDSTESTPLVQAVFGFFQNGGRRCYIVNLGDDGPITGGTAGHRRGLEALAAIDEVAIVAAPGYHDPGSYDALLSHCEDLQDRVAILDPPPDFQTTQQLSRVATVPVPGAPPAETEEPPGLRPRTSDRGYGAFYFPYITIRDPLRPKTVINAPPSGHIAGIYARTDARRGVHKAPANETVRGALNVKYQVTRQDQEELNINGVNCIRLFPRTGTLVWGARTLADSSSEWKYVNVRRLFNMIEESIGRSTRWVVFEPNDQTLWNAIKRDVGAFLMLMWRDGALLGATPDEAFFVKCDAETNTQVEIDAGRVVTIIGIAPVKPAEFVIFRIGQHAGGTEVTTGEA